MQGKVSWKRGVPFSEEFQDFYFSTEGGLAESRYVFIESTGLNQKWARALSFRVGEIGFGTGLNFLLSWKIWEEVHPEGASFSFVTYEKYPLEKHLMEKALAAWPELSPYAKPLITALPIQYCPGVNLMSFAGGHVRLEIRVGDALTELKGCNDPVDAWYLDGFSPAKNPELWSPELFSEIARLSGLETTLSSYTSAGRVRRALASSGFAIEKIPGFGPKREMIRGKRSQFR